MKKLFNILIIVLFSSILVWAEPFNNKLSSADKEKISSGEILIKNINYEKNM